MKKKLTSIGVVGKHLPDPVVGQQPGALVVRVQQVGADGQDATGPENIGGKSGRNLDRENDVIQPQDIRGVP